MDTTIAYLHKDRLKVSPQVAHLPYYRAGFYDGPS